MRLVAQSTSHRNRVLRSFQDVIHPNLKKVLWAVSYVTETGARRLHDHLAERFDKPSWSGAAKSLVTCFDFGITEPTALRYLKHDVGMSIFISDPEVINATGMRPSRAFHPKSYFFLYESDASGIVGSANLTRAALVRNAEVVAVLDQLSREELLQHWGALSDRAVKLTDSLLAKYERSRAVRAATPGYDRVITGPPQVVAADLDLVWSRIDAGALDPAEFQHFWVEAGSMSSGGSHNQLELPRGANRFFGFQFHNYATKQHVEIGKVTLISGAKQWSGRKLTWHGDNGMERLNLPTAAQGGFDYPYSVILFTRRGRRHDLNVSAWEEPVAFEWRIASEGLGMVFRLGGNTDRICGFF